MLTLLASMAPLADWYTAHKPTCAVITLSRRDFDLLLKHEGTSGITVNNGALYWRGFELKPQAAPKKSRGPTSE